MSHIIEGIAIVWGLAGAFVGVVALMGLALWIDEHCPDWAKWIVVAVLITGLGVECGILIWLSDS